MICNVFSSSLIGRDNIITNNWIDLCQDNTSFCQGIYSKPMYMDHVFVLECVHGYKWLDSLVIWAVWLFLVQMLSSNVQRVMPRNVCSADTSIVSVYEIPQRQ